jgi:hypothetical protein
MVVEVGILLRFVYPSGSAGMQFASNFLAVFFCFRPFVLEFPLVRLFLTRTKPSCSEAHIIAASVVRRGELTGIFQGEGFFFSCKSFLFLHQHQRQAILQTYAPNNYDATADSGYDAPNGGKAGVASHPVKKKNVSTASSPIRSFHLS